MFTFTQVIYSTPATTFTTNTKKEAITKYLKNVCSLCIDQTGELPTTEDILATLDCEEFIDNFGSDITQEFECVEELLYSLIQ